MKRTLFGGLLLLCLCLLSSCLNFHPNKQAENSEEIVESNPEDDAAMENSNHLKFKGVPIDGTLDNFVARMKRKGFKLEERENGTAVLVGDFADYKECTVYVSTLEEHDLVSRISVAFPKNEQWQELYGTYKYLKEMLIEKYGKPSYCREKFQSSYINNDNDRMFAVKMDECKYENHFGTDKGEIIVSIEHDGASSCFVMLFYNDKINGSLIREHAKEDL